MLIIVSLTPLALIRDGYAILVWHETHSDTQMQQNIKDIASKMYFAMEHECLKDLEERKNIITQLQDETFKVSKDAYVSLVDSVFKEIDQLKHQKENLSTEQKKLSDDSLVYFEILTNYVLDKFDNIMVELKERGEVEAIEKTEIPTKYFYTDDGRTTVVRKVSLKNNKSIRVEIVNTRQ